MRYDITKTEHKDKNGRCMYDPFNEKLGCSVALINCPVRSAKLSWVELAMLRHQKARLSI